jgi:predicted transposase YbfD/YdcC
MRRGDIMETKCQPLIEILSKIPDFRKEKGKRHPLPAVLALACVAMMCGAKGYSAIAEWGRNYGKEISKALGFTHEKTPCAATFCNIFRKLEVKLMESILGQWADSISSAVGSAVGIAIDGKTLRGSVKQGSGITHLLSAVTHGLGITLAQSSVDSKTNEIGWIGELLKSLVLEGRIITVDALLTQRKVSQEIIEGGGDYVMIVKENQKALMDDVKTVFDGPCSHLLRKCSDKTTDVGHGRIEERFLTSSDELKGYSDWPELHQVFELTRTFITKKTGEVSKETVYGITSLSPDEASAKRLNDLVRSHWHIENKVHWVRDVIFDEDRSQVRCGNTPQVMSAIRNTAIGLMRHSGIVNIASACRRFSAKPKMALELIGIRI